MSNQQQLFLGISGWAIDHENLYPETPHHVWDIDYRSPPYLLNDAEATGYPNDLSMATIAPYMDTSPNDGLHKAWACPELKTDLKTPSIGNGIVYWEITYCYYSNINLWAWQASMPDDLTEKRPDPNRLLITCKFGWVPYFGAWDGYSPETFRGMNQLYGDGHVVWKKSSEFNMDVIKSHNWDASIKMINWKRNDFLYY